MTTLKAERLAEEEFEVIEIVMDDLTDAEFEREKFRNLREQTAMLLHIVDQKTVIWYPEAVRTKFEVRNGVKIATARGAKLNEVEIFNLLFRFRGGLDAGEALALMCHGPKGQEWILLCPDDTQLQIEKERQKYLGVANTLTFKGRMDSAVQNHLISNLELLNAGTRCANTLLHEYGHVLQHRMWASAGIRPNDQAGMYAWFEEIGYLRNVMKRKSGFFEAPVYYLKESFVEDYRIGLNLASRESIFELPNAYCYHSDFKEPELLAEGVDIVKTTIRHFQTDAKTTKQAEMIYEAEPNRVAIIDRDIASGALDFVPGQVKYTAEDHRRMLERLREEQIR